MALKTKDAKWLNAELFTPFQHEQALLYEHAECIATRAFLKMVSLPFSLEQRPNAEFMSPKFGEIPFLKLESTLVPGFLNIVDVVAQKGIKLTNILSDAEVADMQALISLIYQNLVNAEVFSWKDQSNYTKVTKVRYGSVYPGPLKWILPYLKRREILSQLDDLGWSDNLEEANRKAEVCFQALSLKLGNKKYLMGSEPTELDALAFGHLFTIFTTELPTMHLAASLRKHANLMKYCCDIDEQYFKR